MHNELIQMLVRDHGFTAGRPHGAIRRYPGMGEVRLRRQPDAWRIDERGGYPWLLWAEVEVTSCLTEEKLRDLALNWLDLDDCEWGMELWRVGESRVIRVSEPVFT